jgi:hypothetical protein
MYRESSPKPLGQHLIKRGSETSHQPTDDSDERNEDLLSSIRILADVYYKKSVERGQARRAFIRLLESMILSMLDLASLSFTGRTSGTGGCRSPFLPHARDERSSPWWVLFLVVGAHGYRSKSEALPLVQQSHVAGREA